MGSPGRKFALPLVLLALTLQLFAPAAAARMAAAMADPFAAMPICSAGQQTDGKSKQAPAHHDCEHCVLCTLVAPTHALGADPVALPTPSETVLARPRVHAQASPRGPPLWRPNARAPPAFT